MPLCSSLSLSSAAALLVKVMARMWLGCTFWNHRQTHVLDPVTAKHTSQGCTWVAYCAHEQVALLYHVLWCMQEDLFATVSQHGISRQELSGLSELSEFNHSASATHLVQDHVQHPLNQGGCLASAGTCTPNQERASASARSAPSTISAVSILLSCDLSTIVP